MCFGRNIQGDRPTDRTIGSELSLFLSVLKGTGEGREGRGCIIVFFALCTTHTHTTQRHASPVLSLPSGNTTQRHATKKKGGTCIIYLPPLFFVHISCLQHHQYVRGVCEMCVMIVIMIMIFFCIGIDRSIYQSINQSRSFVHVPTATASTIVSRERSACVCVCVGGWGCGRHICTALHMEMIRAMHIVSTMWRHTARRRREAVSSTCGGSGGGDRRNK